MNENTWVDFRAIKQAVSFEAVLGHYGINWLRKSGDNFVGRCPIHQGQGERSFSVNYFKKGFTCWSCKAKGNVLEFVAAMEHCTLREAALKLQTEFNLPIPIQPVAGERTERAAGKPKPAESEPATKESKAENTPLAFALKGIDSTHEYLRERGIQQTTAELFGVGFFPGKGSMSGRVVIPIQNTTGRLVAYAGRSVDGSEPKYKLPAGFRKSLELFNFHRAVKAEAKGRVIVVEGFFDCMKVHQAGFPGVVALMGCEISDAQACVLADSFYELVLMLDGDDAGRGGTAHAAARLARRCWVRIVELDEGKQPDGLSSSELQELLNAI